MAIGREAFQLGLHPFCYFPLFVAWYALQDKELNKHVADSRPNSARCANIEPAYGMLHLYSDKRPIMPS